MSNLERQLRKVSGICGILAPIVAFACILLSILFASSFSWTDNALSDLGIMPDPTAILFNSGLIVGGLLAIVFAVGLFFFIKDKSVGRVGALLFIIDCLALTGIGVFPENTGSMHLYVSVAFFALFPFSMFLITTYFVLASRNKMAIFTFLVSVFAASVWIAEFWIKYVPGVAIPETLSGVATSLWAVFTSITMLKTEPRLNKQ